MKDKCPLNNCFRLINSCDSSTGVSPLQLAVERCNVAMINKLLQLGASIEQLDFEGNNVFHYAANSNREVIMVSIEFTLSF